MVEPWAVFQEPSWERMIGRERLDEWEVRIAEVEVGEADAAVVNDLGADHGEPEFIAPDFERVIGRGNCAGEVIEALVVHGRKRSMDERRLHACRRLVGAWVGLETGGSGTTVWGGQSGWDRRGARGDPSAGRNGRGRW